MAEESGSVKFDERASQDFLRAERDPESWWITFHQSYSYEDFVIGLRTQAGAGFHIQPQAGPFLEASAHASRPGGESLILIDEINRGNTSRAFGELITLMEADKRTDAGHEILVDLPGVPLGGLAVEVQRSSSGSEKLMVARRFSLSPRVYVLASMNSVDRTVAPLDAALRRRFRIVPLRPDYEALRTHLGITPADEEGLLAGKDETNPAYWKTLALVALRNVNARIRALSGSDVELGHAYLWSLGGKTNINELRRTISEILEFQIVPQVEELYRGNDELIGVVLAAEEGTGSYPIRLEEPPSEVADVGGRKVIAYGKWHDADLGAQLRRLAALG